MELKRKAWDTASIISQIHSMARECASPYNTGFVTFDLKKDLYQIKEVLDQALKESPDFGEMEKEWLQDQEKKRIIRHLKS